MKFKLNKNQLSLIITRMLAFFLVFILMKVCANGLLQDASWWWITCPLWCPTGLYLIWFCLCWIYHFIATTEWVGTADPNDENF